MPDARWAGALTTTFILRYIHDESLRRRIQLQLNRGEARHALARRLFFGNSGEFLRGDMHEVMNKASCLSIDWETIEPVDIDSGPSLVEQIRARRRLKQGTDRARATERHEAT